MNRYSNFLTILLIIVIIAIIGFLAFGGYTVYKQFTSTKEANEFVNSFINGANNDVNNTANNSNNISGDDPLNQVENTPSGSGSSTGQTFQGFAVIGTIEIPKINLAYPILKDASPAAIEKSVAKLYGVNPNEPGNILIIGHNYRNGRLFANNKKLSVGDKIYITDLSGQRLTYTIYDKFETTTEDVSFITRNTNGAREISLQTCTDDGNFRLIILAKCDLDS